MHLMEIIIGFSEITVGIEISLISERLGTLRDLKWLIEPSLLVKQQISNEGILSFPNFHVNRTPTLSTVPCEMTFVVYSKKSIRYCGFCLDL